MSVIEFLFGRDTFCCMRERVQSPKPGLRIVSAADRIEVSPRRKAPETKNIALELPVDENTFVPVDLYKELMAAGKVARQNGVHRCERQPATRSRTNQGVTRLVLNE